jgi:hypothetical protein
MVRAVAGEGLDVCQLSAFIHDMAEPKPRDPAVAPDAVPKKPLSPAAQRALAEAEARRRAAATPERPAEMQGRGGLDPTRYGDWEVKGIASDF